MSKSVYRVQSTVTLQSGDTIEVDDYVVVRGGLLTAARRVAESQLKLRYRDSDGEWSDVVQCDAHHGTPLCELTVG